MPSLALAAITGNYDLGNSSTGQVSTKVIGLRVGSLTGSFQVQGRLQDSGLTFLPIPYRKRYLNGAVGDDTYVSTALTGDSIIEVNAAGLEIRLAYTHTSGTVGTGSLRWVDLVG